MTAEPVPGAGLQTDAATTAERLERLLAAKRAGTAAAVAKIEEIEKPPPKIDLRAHRYGQPLPLTENEAQVAVAAGIAAVRAIKATMPPRVKLPDVLGPEQWWCPHAQYPWMAKLGPPFPNCKVCSDDERAAKYRPKLLVVP